MIDTRDVDTYLGGIGVCLIWASKALFGSVISRYVGYRACTIKSIISLKISSWKLVYGEDNSLVICLIEIMDTIIKDGKFFESAENVSIRVLNTITNCKCELKDHERELIIQRTKQVASHISDVSYMGISKSSKKDIVPLMILFAFEDVLERNIKL